jgi:hypothetical protein
MGSMPRCASTATTLSPTGPQPSTRAPSPASIRDRLTACRPTAVGSVNAAWRGSSPLGTSTSNGADSSMRSP